MPWHQLKEIFDLFFLFIYRDLSVYRLGKLIRGYRVRDGKEKFAFAVDYAEATRLGDKRVFVEYHSFAIALDCDRAY